MECSRLLAYWQQFAGASPLRRLGQQAIVAAGVSLVARGAGFAKEVAVAFVFGLSGHLDIYVLAFVLVSFPAGILLNAVQTTFITRLSGMDRREDIRQLSGATIAGTSLLLVCILLFWLLFVPCLLPWLAAGFSGEKQDQLLKAFWWMLSYSFLSGLNLLGYGLLQSQGKFLQNGLLPIITSLVFIVFLPVFGNAGWEVLVMALNTGTFLEGAVLAFLLYRLKLVALPSWKFPRLRLFLPVLSSASVLLPATATGAFVLLFEQSVAASLGEGSNAVLGYGLRLPAALQGILVTAIGITVLPYFSQQVTSEKYSYCLHSLNRIFRFLSLGGLLLAGILVFFSADLVTLFYRRGNFDEMAVIRVTPVQTAYLMQIPFALLNMTGIKILVALDRNMTLSLVTVVLGVTQMMLAWIFSTHYGLAGIAWAGTVTTALGAGITYRIAVFVLKQRDNNIVVPFSEDR